MWCLFLLIVFQYQIIVNAMELKGINSCQTSLLIHSQIQTSSAHLISNAWCPSAFDRQPYLVVSLPQLTYLTRLNLQSLSSDVSYHLEYTRENVIEQSTVWHAYRLFNDQQETLPFDPPIIAKHLRLNLKHIKSDRCIRLEVFGCEFTDGVMSYSMLQGARQLEDDTYDGEYNAEHRYLYNGLGQLSDGQTGSDDHEKAGGLQWVGWRKPRAARTNASIAILFTFDTLRNFSRVTIHTNNNYPKKIFAFRSVRIEFVNEKNISFLTYHRQRDDQFDMARPIMFDLKHHIASQIRLRLFFDGNWILIDEVTFDSIIVLQTPIIQSQTIHFSVYLIMSLFILIILFTLPIVVLLMRRLSNRKALFTSIHNRTDSSLSTTSSAMENSSSPHRYATIVSVHPYHVWRNTSDHTKSVSQSISDNQIEGVCGNSTYGSQRLFTFDPSRTPWIPKHQIFLKQKMENRHQIIAEGEIYQGEFHVNHGFVPVTIRRLLSNASMKSKITFFNEISLLTSLCHPNLIHTYGLCSESGISLLTESFDQSTMDLYQYLQHYKHETSSENTRYTTAVFFARQISSALVYLESLQITHRDLAARNCSITSDLHVKLHDLAMSNETYADDYVSIELENNIRTRRPIRWCAWETIVLNQFSSKSDVFSFGILLWEILTMADRPHSLLNDEQVLHNLQNSYHCLTIPSYAEDLTELIFTCWQKHSDDRPSFAQLDRSLNEKQYVLNNKAHLYQQID